MSTLREPYRIEGKKTMAYELVEQMRRRGAGCDPVSHGRRHRSHRHVEGVRRDGSGSAGFRAAGGRVSFPCRRRAVRRWRRLSTKAPSAPSPGRTRRPALMGCACRRRSAASFACARCAKRMARRSPSTKRKRHAPRASSLRASGIDVCPGRRRRVGRAREAARQRLRTRRRHRGRLQHGHGLEVSLSAAARLTSTTAVRMCLRGARSPRRRRALACYAIERTTPPSTRSAAPVVAEACALQT